MNDYVSIVFCAKFCQILLRMPILPNVVLARFIRHMPILTKV